jgi:hypothetical protein
MLPHNGKIFKKLKIRVHEYPTEEASDDAVKIVNLL